MLIDSSVVSDSADGPRVLVVSVRGFRFQVANCALYEFEDLICDLEGAQLYTPTQEFDFARKIYRFAKYAIGSDTIASSLAQFPTEVVLEDEYDLLFAVFDNPWQLHLLESIKNWRDKCRYKACYIMETWKPYFDDWRLIKEPFKNFDHIFSATNNCVELYSEVTGLPCNYLAPALDALKFCPYPNSPQRVIDICWFGRRRPEETHQAIFEHSQQDDSFFYHYDTFSNATLEVANPRHHRAKLISLLQRSHYSMATHSRLDVHSRTGGAQEIGFRYFEGVASGSVLIGMPPMGEMFPRYFDWDDAVVKVDLYEQDVLEVIQDLNANPDRVKAIRYRNVANALLKHDWVYRWREVLAAFDLQPSSAVIAREKQLQQLAYNVRANRSLVC